MNAQQKLLDILKKKGTGHTMSKSLEMDDMTALKTLLKDPSGNLTTQAALTTAILMLEPTDAETEFLQELKRNPESYLSNELVAIFFGDATTKFETSIQHVIQHQHLSKDVMEAGTKSVLDPAVPDYLKAIFLEGLRLKRETEIENTACLDVLYKRSQHQRVDVPILIDLANAYDGLNRTELITVHLAALLASVGFPTVVHGAYEVGPKRGMTAHKFLKTAGKNPLQSLEACKSNLENPEIGWTYVDQSISNPEVYALQNLRTNMLKRPLLSTLEKLLQPMVGTGKNYLVTSYTHPPYKEMLATILRHQDRFNRHLIFRGQEGSIQLALDQASRCLVVEKHHLEEDFVQPDGIQDPLVYMGVTILTKLGLGDKDALQSQLTQSVESGRYLQNFEKGCRLPLLAERERDRRVRSS